MFFLAKSAFIVFLVFLSSLDALNRIGSLLLNMHSSQSFSSIDVFSEHPSCLINRKISNYSALTDHWNHLVIIYFHAINIFIFTNHIKLFSGDRNTLFIILIMMVSKMSLIKARLLSYTSMPSIYLYLQITSNFSQLLLEY